MPLSKRDGMTVEELIDALRGYDPDLPVLLAVRAGPTTLFEEIVDLSPRRARFSDQREMLIDVPHGAPVIVLETAP